MDIGQHIKHKKKTPIKIEPVSEIRNQFPNTKFRIFFNKL